MIFFSCRDFLYGKPAEDLSREGAARIGGLWDTGRCWFPLNFYNTKSKAIVQGYIENFTNQRRSLYIINFCFISVDVISTYFPVLFCQILYVIFHIFSLWPINNTIKLSCLLSSNTSCCKVRY